MEIVGKKLSFPLVTVEKLASVLVAFQRHPPRDDEMRASIAIFTGPHGSGAVYKNLKYSKIWVKIAGQLGEHCRGTKLSRWC